MKGAGFQMTVAGGTGYEMTGVGAGAGFQMTVAGAGGQGFK